jgi:DNA-binding PadR family transcriptional regulator
MALKHVLLGLLLDRPDHGYSLKHRLSPGLPREHLINDGVLYPLLGRLEKDGLLSSQTAHVAGRERRLFDTTAQGRHAFLAWLHSDADEAHEPTYELYAAHPLVKLLFAEHLSEAQRRAKLARHASGVSQRVATLERLREIAPAPPSRRGNTAWLQLEIEQEQHRLEGLRALLADSNDDPRNELEEPPWRH